MTILLLSGLQIFNAHPALYWGDRSDRDRPVFAVYARMTPDQPPAGVTRIFGHEFNTTGVLGWSRTDYGGYVARGFPTWATLPGPQWLAMGRRWHLFFAWLLVTNGLVYLIWSVRSRHLVRDVVPRKTDWLALPRSVIRHLSFRFTHTAGYNPLQKLSYAVVVLVLAPLMVLTGLSMSPWIESVLPISEVFGGRQSARTVHFLVAFALLAFTFVHILMVLLTGPLSRLRGITIGNGNE